MNQITLPQSVPSQVTRFQELLDQDCLEQVYQAELERSPRLIPQEFVQNHGIHFGLIFRKLKLAENYITDFLFISKSSADWNVVLIELEKPSSRYFKDGSNEFHPDFISGLSQVNSWRAWCNRNGNLQHLLSQTLDPIWVPSAMRVNPIYPKFVLVTGRRSELAIDTVRRSLVQAQEQHDFKILSYDSLLDGYRTNEPIYVAVKTNTHIRILGDDYVSALDFDWMEPDRYEVSETLIERIRSAGAGSNDQVPDWFRGESYNSKLSRVKVMKA